MEQPRIRAQSAGEKKQGTINQHHVHGNEPGHGWPGVTGQGGVFQCFPRIKGLRIQSNGFNKIKNVFRLDKVSFDATRV